MTEELQVAAQLAHHRIPFAMYGGWRMTDAGLPLDMHRFRAANEDGCGDGAFPTRPPGATNQFAMSMWRVRNPARA